MHAYIACGIQSLKGIKGGFCCLVEILLSEERNVFVFKTSIPANYL